MADRFEFAAPRWLDPGWQRGAFDWVDEQLGRHGLEATGPPEQVHAVPWSTVFRVATPDGPMWFKANNSGTAYEAGLAEALGRWCPDRVLVPLAVDAAQGWTLLPDGGTTLRAAQAGHTDLDHWERILVEYAELQRLLAPHVAELTAMGVPDRRPAALTSSLAELLADEELLRIGLADGLTPEQLSALRAQHDRYAALCAELDATGVAPSLQHDDLHDANVFVAPGHYRVFDWGDASVGHPFATLLVTLRVVSDRMSLPDGAPELMRLRDAYLEPWTAEHGLADLREAARLAVRTGGVARALAWRRALQGATRAAIQEYGEGVTGWLLEVWEPTPLEP